MAGFGDGDRQGHLMFTKNKWFRPVGISKWGARRGANNIKAKPIDGEQVGHGNYGGLVFGEWI